MISTLAAQIECLLIADDLTGACDAAVHFAIRGLGPVIVRLSADAPALPAPVIACTTETRDSSAGYIRAALHSVAAEYAATPVARVFKKIDSTLRGNAGADIAAARDAFQCDTAVVCPAFPAMRRVVEGGMLRVTNTPQFTPLNVATRLSTQSGELCAHTTPQCVPALLAQGARLISVDAATDADLDQIAAAILPSTRRVLWTGSGGLASALARSLSPDAAQPIAPSPSPARALFCLGSNHPVTLDQQAALLTARPHGHHAILRITRGQVPETLGTSAPAALILSGGDTASLICRAIHAHAIELHDEIVPGVPRGTLRGGPFDGLPVVTKSGAFGDRDTLIQVADFFHAPV